MALTPADFDFDKETVTINKSYQRLHGEDVITTPKTKKSNRTIKMPHFLCEEMQEYLGMIYGLKKKDRIFTVTKSYLHHEMDRGAKAAGVKRIRIHDLRHSHISLLNKLMILLGKNLCQMGYQKTYFKNLRNIMMKILALYFIIKWAVKNGIKEAYRDITEKVTTEYIEVEQICNEEEK